MYALIGGFVMAVLTGLMAYHAGGNGKYAEGWSEGDKAGYARGVEQTHKLRDKELAALLAETRAEAAEKTKEYQDTTRAIETRQRAAIEAARGDYAKDTSRLHADLERIRKRLRDAQAKTRDRVPDDPRKLPESGTAPDGGALAPGVVLDGSGEALIRIAEAAERVNGQYQICYRYARALQ